MDGKAVRLYCARTNNQGPRNDFSHTVRVSNRLFWDCDDDHCHYDRSDSWPVHAYLKSALYWDIVMFWRYRGRTERTDTSAAGQPRSREPYSRVVPSYKESSCSWWICRTTDDNKLHGRFGAKDSPKWGKIYNLIAGTVIWGHVEESMIFVGISTSVIFRMVIIAHFISVGVGICTLVHLVVREELFYSWTVSHLLVVQILSLSHLRLQ